MTRSPRLYRYLVLASALLVAACGGGGEDPKPPSATPTITSFTAAPDTISSGSSSTLTWSVSNATSVELNGTVVTGTSSEVRPTSTTTYTLVAKNGSQNASRTATVTVTPVTATPVINSFSAAPATITSGQSSTLTWSVSNATSVELNGTVVTGTSSEVRPTSTTTYTLVAKNGSQASEPRSQTVTVSSAPPPTPTLALAAFPGAEGMAAGATGGRGGVVYTVNTLEDTLNNPRPWNGPHGDKCSLRDALVARGPRTVVFSVGGTITISGGVPKDGEYNIYPVRGDLTIAGQTAPGGGIQIRTDGRFTRDFAMLDLMGNNIVIRYLRFRPGKGLADSGGRATGGISVGAFSDILIDHCSFEWDSDKPYSAEAALRQTLSWNLFAEGLYGHSVGPMCMNEEQANMDKGTFEAHHNVFATLDHRIPEAMAKHVRWVNNLTFGYRYASVVPGGVQAEFVGNVYDGGSARGGTANLQAETNRHEVRWLRTSAHYENLPVPGGTAQFFLDNNFGPSNPDGRADNFVSMLRETNLRDGTANDPDDGMPPLAETFRATRSTIPAELNRFPITIHRLSKASDLRDVLLPSVGAFQRLDAATGGWVPARDSVDSRILGYIQDPTKSPSALYNPSTNDAIPFPALASGTPYVDSDGDGMPDAWETDHGLNPRDYNDCNTKRPGANGYTNLELYLSGNFPIGTPLP